MKIGTQIAGCMIRIRIKLKGNSGFGMNELLGIAAGLILAAFIIIPGLQGFARSVMGELTDWWGTDVMSRIFPPPPAG